MISAIIAQQMQEPDEAIVELQAVLSQRDDIEELVSIYLLASILEQASINNTALPGEVSLFSHHTLHVQLEMPYVAHLTNFCEPK